LTVERDVYYNILPSSNGHGLRRIVTKIKVGKQGLNRQHPNVFACFEAVLGKKDLMCSIDRIGMMRPTKGRRGVLLFCFERDFLGITLPNGKVVNRPEWKTDKNWLHWDQNPWSEPDFARVQGLVALSDFTNTSGGFHCVPGFVNFFKDWANRHQDIRSPGGLVEVPAKDAMRKFITKIGMRAGSFLIWDSRTPHGNFPNKDNTFRITQYITMFPADDSVRASMVVVLKNNIHTDTPFTDLGKKLLGLEKWSTDEDFL